jgi:regulator of sirC expression with transglutaminase-like and TPR domain
VRQDTFDGHATALDRLATLVEGPGPLDLVAAGLVVASEEYPDLDVGAERRRVDDLGQDAAERISDLSNPFARLDALRVFLFEDLGFRGNDEDYYDPRNSFLNEVIKRRLGIPLSLSILYIEVARAAGLDARGVGLPGHFVVRVDDGGRRLLIDPYHGGGVITEEDCRQLVARSTGRPGLFRPDLLEGVGPTEMLGRLLRNLKRIYLAREDHRRALAVVDKLRRVFPDESTELRDRGFLLAHLDRHEAAVADLEAYLALHPHAPDANAVRGRISWLRRRISQLN